MAGEKQGATGPQADVYERTGTGDGAELTARAIEREGKESLGLFMRARRGGARSRLGGGACPQASASDPLTQFPLRTG